MTKIEKELLAKINNLQAKNMLVLFKVEGGNLFFMKDHHKYIRHGEAPPFLIGKAPKGVPTGEYYVTHQMPDLESVFSTTVTKSKK